MVSELLGENLCSSNTMLGDSITDSQLKLPLALILSVSLKASIRMGLKLLTILIAYHTPMIYFLMIPIKKTNHGISNNTHCLSNFWVYSCVIMHTNINSFLEPIRCYFLIAVTFQLMSHSWSYSTCTTSCFTCANATHLYTNYSTFKFQTSEGDDDVLQL